MQSTLRWSMLLVTLGAAAKNASGQGPDDTTGWVAVAELRAVTIDSTAPLDTARIIAAVRLLDSLLPSTDDDQLVVAASRAYAALGEQLVDQRLAYAIASSILERALRYRPAEADSARLYLLLGTAHYFHVYETLADWEGDGSCRAQQALRQRNEITA